jgi:hypothetical protein
LIKGSIEKQKATEKTGFVSGEGNCVYCLAAGNANGHSGWKLNFPN